MHLSHHRKPVCLTHYYLRPGDGERSAIKGKDFFAIPLLVL
jgi:hypothetical protein